MGERLVIAIANDDDNPTQKACIYYHWSNYFKTAILETMQVCEAILNAEKENKDIYLAIERMLEEKDGGIRGTEKDVEAAEKLYPGEKFKSGSRNSGIMSFTDEGIGSFLAWAEGMVIINTKTREIDFQVYNDVEPFEFGNNIIQELGETGGYIVGTSRTGSSYIRYNEYTCPIDMNNELTIDNMEQVYNFVTEFYNTPNDGKESGLNAVKFFKEHASELLGIPTVIYEPEE